MMEKRYMYGWTDPNATYGFISVHETEYAIKLCNWLPPKYAVVKKISGKEIETMATNVSKKSAQGYLKLLKDE